MSINPEDVKLYESQRLTDEDDGGGRATGNEVVDGAANNLFPDISRLDRTLGDVSLRKAFVGIDTANYDTYLGAHAIIVEPPADSNVSVVLFEASSESDERSDAQNQIENYVVQGSASTLDLLGNQYQGQRQIVCVQRVEQTQPSVGDVFMLLDQDSVESQYVRVTEVEAEINTYTYLQGNTYTDFDRRRLVMSISAPLNHTFDGGEPTPTGPNGTPSTVFSTEVADAARYWGVTTAEDAATTGDVMIKAASIYANLVPSAQAESPLLDAALGYESIAVRQSATSDHTATVTALYIDGQNIRAYLPRAAVLGTVQLTLGASLYTDDGSGILTRTTGSNPFDTLDIDYTTGLISGIRNTSSGSGTIAGSATFRLGVAYTGRMETLAVDVSLQTRSYNYTANFAAAKPRPGTMVVSYMVLGKWYELREDGTGQLQGAGTGSVDFVTGSVLVTLEALPDVGSAVVYAYMMDIEAEAEVHNGTNATAGAEAVLLVSPGILPGTVSLTYTAGAQTKTLTDVATVGALAGDGTGTVDYASGIITLLPDLIPDQGTTYDIDYDQAVPQTEVLSDPTVTAKEISGTLANFPIEAGTLSFTFTVYRQQSQGGTLPVNKTMRDDGVGGFIDKDGVATTGTINYTTGAYTLQVVEDYSYNYSSISRTPATGLQLFGTVNVDKTETDPGTVNVGYNESADVFGSTTDNLTPESLEIALITSTPNELIPGSLLFTFGGKEYFDRDGILYTDFNTQTGSGTAVGTMNYTNRKALLDAWTPGTAPGITLLAALTVSEVAYVSYIEFRTPSAPLRPQSLQITITDADGNLITESADADGVISGASVSGTVNVENGVVKLWFTTDDTDQTDSSDVRVFPSTGRYNTVMYSFLPLDAELIGLDPVRLPSDGRVPVFREGDVVVISHTTTTETGNSGTPIADQVDTLARGYNASILVVDSLGVELDPAQYVIDKVAGTVTFDSALVLQDVALNALTAPMDIIDRVEHMSVLNDVQITGEISFIAPLAHDYPADETVVSSALVWGDINSRYFKFFTQKTWDSGTPNWTEARIGDDTTAQYNEIDNPVEITNNGAITENWALVFTDTTTFNIVGENLGIIGQGTILTDCQPLNPNTTNPYFIIRTAGWGSGWIAGNVIRFNTEGCLASLWIGRTVLSGQAEEEDDQFILQIRGDAD